MPREVAERISAYRGLLAERRVLVVVDNVAHHEQIQPLLPGGFSSALLFSSRMPLTGVPGARHFPLSLFTTEQAVELLARIVGEDRTLADRLLDEETRMFELVHGDLDVSSRLDTGVAALPDRARQSFLTVAKPVRHPSPSSTPPAHSAAGRRTRRS